MSITNSPKHHPKLDKNEVDYDDEFDELGGAELEFLMSQYEEPSNSQSSSQPLLPNPPNTPPSSSVPFLSWRESRGDDQSDNEEDEQTPALSRPIKVSSSPPVSQETVLSSKLSNLVLSSQPDPELSLPNTLSAEQQQVLDLVLGGTSVFFSGPAGTGKSFLLKEIIKRLRMRNKCVAVTATTGIAALPIQGQTIHSWAGIGPGVLPAEVLYRTIAKLKWDKEQEEWVENESTTGKVVLDRWRETDVLVLDELSMLDGELFDKLEFIARQTRSNDKPFGGIQLVFLGDFFQLPPVPNNNKAAMFAFEANAWDKCIENVVMLKKVFRQEEEAFVRVLNQMRVGKMDPGSIKLLSKLDRDIQGQVLTELYPTRSQVTVANALHLRSLTGALLKYPALDYPGFTPTGKPVSENQTKAALRSCRAGELLELKVGARVMLIVNLGKDSPTLVNGSTGTIVQFLTLSTARQKGIRIAEQFVKLPEHANRNHVQLETNPLEGKTPLPIEGKIPPVFPVIKFDTETVLIPPFRFEEEGYSSKGTTHVEATRVQLPLTLGWALSIHKSQGMTLDKIKIDLSRTFERGQAYVAISRCVSLEGLQVLHFAPEKVRAHPKVLLWADEKRIDRRKK